MAHSLAFPGFLGQLELTPAESLIELEANEELAGSFGRLSWPRRLEVTIVALVRGDTVRTGPDLLPETTVDAGDRLVVLGRPGALDRLPTLASS